MKNFALVMSLFCAALWLAGCREKPAAPPPAVEVGVYTVKSREVPLSFQLPGRTAAFRVAEVRPQVSGIVLFKTFEEGAMVAEGDQLYQIDDAPYKAAYDKALAARDNLERLSRRRAALKGQRSISAQDYEDALYAWEQAKADAEVARLNYGYCQVKAPLSGKIGRSNVTKGALVTNGQAQAMAVINQIDPIYVDLAPAMAQLLAGRALVGPGQTELEFLEGAEARLTLENGEAYPLPGALKFIDNRVDESTGTVTVRAQFPNPQGLLLPGMYVRATVVVGSLPAALVVPQQALARDMKGQPQVWVVTGDGRAELRPVVAERTVGNGWLVSGGLADGERVVAEGLQRLANGVAVAPHEAQVGLRLDMRGE